MNVVAAVIVGMFGIALIVFASVAFANPAVAERFLTAFASSARTHYIEQFCRVLIGAAMVVRSSAMWQPALFRLFGWAVIVSSAILICLPWQWHQRLGERMRPLLLRHLKLYAVGAFALGVLVLCGGFGR